MELRPTHQAVFDALTDEPQTVWEIHLRRMQASGLPAPHTHGMAATLAALDFLEKRNMAWLSKNKNGASCYRK